MKSVVLGVTGSIAAYKACDIVSTLKKNKEIDVDVIMTESAQKLVCPATFQTLSKNPVSTEIFQEVKYWQVSHIELAKKADVLVIAPATANIIAKLANGIADDMLSTVALATKSQILIAPAMNTNMYDNEATQKNIQILKQRGIKFIEPVYGLLACEDVGRGKLADVEDILYEINNILYSTKELEGKNILITAGPTIEDIDPVRYLTNRSTGKMGYAIATAAVMQGANVTLVSGKVNIVQPKNLKKFIGVRSAKDMYDAVISEFDEQDIIIKSAAVADFTPINKSDQKIKKQEGTQTIELGRTIDILKELGQIKKHQILVGFAAETANVEEYAHNKLKTKKLDMIVANDVSNEKIGFSSENNAVSIFTKNNNKYNVQFQSKDNIAKEILKIIKKELI